jgi:hypothetical protein
MENSYWINTVNAYNTIRFPNKSHNKQHRLSGRNFIMLEKVVYFV